MNTDPRQKPLPVVWQDCSWNLGVIVRSPKASQIRCQTSKSREASWTAAVPCRFPLPKTEMLPLASAPAHAGGYPEHGIAALAAFTLVELLVVISIIAILAALL